MIRVIAWMLLAALAVVPLNNALAQPPSLTTEQQSRLREASELMHKAGQLHFEQGKAKDAIPFAKKALAIRREILGNNVNTVTSLISLGALSEAVGNYAAARLYCEQARTINKQVSGERSPDYAADLNKLGCLLQTMGDYETARSYLEQALAIRREVLGENHLNTARTLNNLGVLLNTTGDYPAAWPYLQQALAIFQKIVGEENADTAMTLNNLGFSLEGMGNYTAARPYYERALAIEKKVLGERHRNTATSLNNLGLLLNAIGDYATARLHLEQALAIRKDLLGEKHPVTATSTHNLGFLLLTMGDYAAARPCFEEALAIKREILGEVHPSTAASLSSLGALLNSMGHFEAARPHLEQALEIRTEVLGEKHRETALSLNNLGYAFWLAGNYVAARQYHERALAIRKEILGEGHMDTMMSFHNLSGLEAASGRWEHAAQYEDQARRIMRRHVARVLPSLSARQQANFLWAKHEGPFHMALSMALLRAADPRLAAMSSGWVLNGKAVAREALSQIALLSRESNDPTVANAVEELLTLRRQLATLTLSTPKSGQQAAHRIRLEQLEQQDETLTRRIAEANGKAFQPDPWVEMAAVRRALPADAVLIDIARFWFYDFKAKEKENWWQPPRYAAWVLRAANNQQPVEIIDLGEADKIDQAVQEVREALQAAPGRQGTISLQGEPEAEKLLQEPLQQLAKLVLEPIVNQIGGAKEIVLSPDAALWLVPWGALPLADGRYAIEEYQIRYVVSGRDLVAQRAADVQTNQPIIMADPDFDLNPDKAEYLTRAILGEPQLAQTDELHSFEPTASSTALPKFTRLPYTAAEAQLIAPPLESYTDETPIVYTDHLALEGIFKAFRNQKVVVLSTHGYFLEDQEAKKNGRMLTTTETRGIALTVDGKPIENPLLRCGLLLAGCNRSGEAPAAGAEDGVLTGMEIVGTDFRGTELVVLSACETGLGQVRNGEGVAGLRQAFQLAGAQAVVATLWQIPDRESARLMTTFFENLAAGQSKPDALRNAQLAVIEYRREKHAAAHPFFWAAFTITGE